MSAKESTKIQTLKRLDTVRVEIQRNLLDDFDPERKLEEVNGKESAFGIFMDKMNAAEKSVQEHGYYAEKEVEEELDKI